MRPVIVIVTVAELSGFYILTVLSPTVDSLSSTVLFDSVKVETAIYATESYGPELRRNEQFCIVRCTGTDSVMIKEP